MFNEVNNIFFFNFNILILIENFGSYKKDHSKLIEVIWSFIIKKWILVSYPIMLVCIIIIKIVRYLG